MGGVVVSVLSTRNYLSSGSHEDIVKTRNMGPQAVAVTAPTATESSIYRNPDVKDATLDDLYKKFYGIEDKTLLVLLKKSCQQHGTRKAMAHRPIDRIEKTEIEENGKKKQWEYVHLKPTEFITFSMLWDLVTDFGSGLRALGFRPGDRFGLYEETRWEWMISLYGAWHQNLVGVTVYANLGEDALEYAIKEAELPIILCNGKAVKNLIAMCAKAKIKVPTVIYTDDIPSGVKTDGMQVHSFDSVLQRGRKSRQEEVLPASSDDLALIMYTSGTTGDPKGVMISHGNVIATVLGLEGRVEQFAGQVGDDDSYVAYLPLAHILEFAAENVMLLRGALVGYGNPRTLTNNSARPHGDLQEFRPLFLAGVPRVFDTIKKAVESKLPPTGLKRRVFDKAFEERRVALSKGYNTPYWDSKVFALPRELLGGRCKAIVSGGAPMSAKTQEFLEIVFGCSVAQGYGLTETCASCSTQRYWDTNTENIGSLLPNIELKLRDVEDWKHTDVQPRGEICLRGPVITKGYYKQEDKTAEAYKDGWFQTGDVGQILPDGSLKIIGRVKALAKNVFGEYVALDALESVYVLNEVAIPNGVCLLVDPQKPYVAALVLTDEHKAMAFAKKHGIEGSWPDVLKVPEFHTKAAASLAETAKAARKKPFETVKYVRVLHDEWTPENGVLTAAMKLKRRVVDQKYANIIQELFKPEQ